MAVKDAAGRADLHTHTTASDGTGSPADNVRLAREAGLAAVAITDHDTTAGIEEALAEGARLGIRVVPGVELSTMEDGLEIHVLGYFLDWRGERWQERLRSQRDARNRRNLLIIERLNALGMPIRMEEVERAAAGLAPGRSIGRPHIAAVMVEKGYVASRAEAFDRFLGSEGAAYVRVPRPTPREAVQWIHEAGGAAVIAHPGLYGRDELVEALLREGADGIEARHADHSPEDEARYAAMADRCGVIATAGSDYHGARGGEIFHGPLGSRTVDAAVVDLLEAASRKYR
jgi:Predicted metal-dependent phosphoesterases (PHP family)